MPTAPWSRRTLAADERPADVRAVAERRLLREGHLLLEELELQALILLLLKIPPLLLQLLSSLLLLSGHVLLLAIDGPRQAVRLGCRGPCKRQQEEGDHHCSHAVIVAPRGRASSNSMLPAGLNRAIVAAAPEPLGNLS